MRQKYTHFDHEAAWRAVEQLFREVAARFPDATVRNDIPGPNGEPVVLELSSSVPGTATVRALAAADQVDLYVGDHRWEEIVSRGRQEEMLARVAGRLEQIVRGEFKEWIRGRRVRYVAYGPSSSA